MNETPERQFVWLDCADDLRPGDIVVNRFGPDTAPIEEVKVIDGVSLRIRFADGNSVRWARWARHASDRVHVRRILTDEEAGR